jgi:hypothetical protein
MSSEMMKYLMNIIKPAQANFPEHMYKSFIINAPSVFSVGWSIIKPLLPERTIKKVMILGSDFKDVLLQYIPEEELPVEYGGKNDKTLWEDIEADYTKCTVPARGNVTIEKELPAGSKLTWDFRTISADIGFEVKFVLEGGSATKVINYSRVESFKKIQIGEFVAEKSGKVILTFDNSFSMMTGKQLIYLVQVVDVQMEIKS